MTPTARTLQWLKRLGYVADVSERWLRGPFAVRKDLFGFIDVVAIRDEETIGIQATAGAANVCHRITKIMECEHAKAWLSGRRLWVVGWSKKGARGKRKLWTPTVKEIEFRGGGFGVTDLHP